jgi:hypothetical protein
MEKVLFIFLLIFLFCAPVFGQTGDCPGIELTSPAKSISPGEMLEYTVHVETGGEEIELEYLWAAVYPDAETGKRKNAEIVSGQGTPDIRIKMPGDRITVSVIIGGIREGCPVMVSETVSYILDPAAVLLEDFRGPIAKFDKARIEKINTALKENPDVRLYIFIGYASNGRSKKNREKEAFVMDNFSRHGRNRITFFDVDEKEHVLQIWLVPIGAHEPQFIPKGR